MATDAQLRDLILSSGEGDTAILKVPTNRVYLQYYCEEEHDEIVQYEQPALDVTEVGALICPECGEDMLLDVGVFIR